MSKLTPQQIAIAAAKRRAAIAARKANGGMTVRQQRAAAKAAKAAQNTRSTYSPPRPSAPPPPRPTVTPQVPPPSAASYGSKAYAQPVATYKGLKLVALSAFENAFVMKCKEQGVTQDAREAYAKYQKLKGLALGNVSNFATQNEADTALRMAVIHLVKLAF